MWLGEHADNASNQVLIAKYHATYVAQEYMMDLSNSFFRGINADNSATALKSRFVNATGAITPGIGVKSKLADSSANIEIYDGIVRKDDTSSTSGTYVAMENLGANVGNYFTNSTGFKSGCSGNIVKAIALIGEKINSNQLYNIANSSNGFNVLANNYTIDKVFPASPTEQDCHLLTSVEPIAMYTYDGTDWTEISRVYAGAVITDGSGNITDVVQIGYNQNGYNVTQNTPLVTGSTLTASAINAIMPNYSAGVTKALDTTYTADTDGWLNIRVDGTTVGCKIIVNDILLTSSGIYTDWEVACIAPVSKGDTYLFESGSGTLVNCKFYPCKGVS
jgi:hypothetical protein